MQIYTWQKGIDKKTFNSKFSVVCLSLFAVCRWSLFVTCRCLLFVIVCRYFMSLFLFVVLFVCRSFCLSLFFVCRLFCLSFVIVRRLSLFVVCHCLSFVVVCRLSGARWSTSSIGPGGHGDQVCQYIWLIWSQQSFYGEKMRCHACD